MKKIFFVAVLLMKLNCTISQSLQGEWNGAFTNNAAVSIPPVPIKFYFTLNSDSSYNIYSYTPGYEYKNGTFDTVVCRVTYQMMASDSIFLEETKDVKFKQKDWNSCPQRFYLKIVSAQGGFSMIGNWESIQKECISSGLITLYKKD